ncbi:MAG: nucleotidyltransferase domain-containing protein [Thermoanaerobaculia bacterium]|nr:nucleotidyltransferase domain-containing protein [Thermoanaerobaculia bacterium]
MCGSFARGDARSDSDLDLLVSVDDRSGIARRFLRFCKEASRLPGMLVDASSGRSARFAAPGAESPRGAPPAKNERPR